MIGKSFLYELPIVSTKEMGDRVDQDILDMVNRSLCTPLGRVLHHVKQVISQDAFYLVEEIEC